MYQYRIAHIITCMQLQILKHFCTRQLYYSDKTTIPIPEFELSLPPKGVVNLNSVSLGMTSCVEKQLIEHMHPNQI